MRVPARLEALVLLAPLCASCSVLYDPAQFRTADATALDATALDANGSDASTLDAVAIDAVMPDAVAIDAVAIDAVAIDAVMPDAVAIDAALDTNEQDASLDCSFSRSLVLPRCLLPSTLVYCGPDGATATFPRAMAEQGLPGVAGYRVGLLGNGVDVVRGPSGSITDLELVRGDMPDELHVLFVDATDDDLVTRRRYGVDSVGLMEGPLEPFELGTLDAADVSVAVGRPAEVAVAGRSGTTWSAWSCSSPTDCTSLPSVPDAASLFIAHASSRIVVAYEDTMVGGVRWNRVSPTLFSQSGAGNLGRLRGTAGRFVYPSSTDLTHAQSMFDQERTDPPYTIGIGPGRPRLVQISDMGSPERYALARIERSGSDLVVRRTEVGSCGDMGCGCVGRRCDQVGMVGGVDDLEATLATAGALLVDWDYHELGELRIAVVLVGDSAGTEVRLAFWREGTLPTISPVTIGTGVVSSPPGLGTEIRSVARVESNRLEIFVATRVQIGSEDFVFLAGLRLEGCGS